MSLFKLEDIKKCSKCDEYIVSKDIKKDIENMHMANENSIKDKEVLRNTQLELEKVKIKQEKDKKDLEIQHKKDIELNNKKINEEVLRNTRLVKEEFEKDRIKQQAKDRLEIEKEMSEKHRLEKEILVTAANKEKERTNLEISKLQDRTQSNLSNELKGEGLEDLIENYLKEWHPSDRIEEIKKGKNGADISQIVYQNNKPIGKILIETKNTGSWSSSWENKLIEDMKNIEADFGILISKSKKNNFQEPFELIANDKIAICSLSNLHNIEVVSVMFRNLLSDASRYKNLSANKDDNSAKLLNHFMNPGTKMIIRQTINDFSEENDHIDKKERANNLEITKRRKANDARKNRFFQLLTPLTLIDGVPEDILAIENDIEEEE